MLTVLIKDFSDNSERLFPAKSVSYTPHKDGNDGQLIINNGMVSNYVFGVSLAKESCKTVFVMNDAGQTVARYNL